MTAGESSGLSDTRLVTVPSTTPQQSSYPWLEAINDFNSQYSIPVVVVVGLAGNLLALTVFLCSPLRRITSSVYLAAQAITDLLFLTFLGINWLASIQIHVFSLPGLCHTMVYVTYVVSFLSLWVVVALTFDLYASIQWRCVHRRISRPSRALAITFGLLLIGCATYSFSFWLTTKSIGPDKTVVCLHNGRASLAIAGAAIDSALALVVPFFLLIYMNVRILHVVVSLAKSRSCGSGTTGGKSRPRRRPTSRAMRRRSSVARIPEYGYHRARQTRRRRSQQVIISSLGSSSEGHARKRVSFEDERRISLVFEENGIKYNEDSGEVIVVAKVVVMNDDVKGKDRAGSFRPDSIPENSVSGKLHRTTSSAGNSRRNSANYPMRRLSLSTPLHVHSSVQSFMIEETLSKTINSTGHLSKSRTDLDSTHSMLSKDKNKKRTGKRKTSASKSSRYPLRAHNSLDLPHRIQPRLRKVQRVRRKHSPLTRLQYRCFRMVLSVSIVFLCLNVPSHTIRLQSLVRSLIDPNYRPTQLEYHLQQFLQFFYYLNFVLNVFIYSACAKNFRAACVKIHWHVAETVRQMWGKLCKRKGARSQVSFEECQEEKARENSRHVEICLNDIRLSELEPPMEKPVSPPCLLHLDTQQTRARDRKYNMKLTPPTCSSRVP